MEKTKQRRTFKQFAKDKNIEISVQRYLIDALSFMTSGLFASLLIGTIFNTLGQNLGISLFTDVINPQSNVSVLLPKYCLFLLCLYSVVAEMGHILCIDIPYASRSCPDMVGSAEVLWSI